MRELEHNFLLERADRYQLVLSTVKQLKVIDLLDGLPPSALLGAPSSASSLSFVSFLVWWFNKITLLCALFVSQKVLLNNCLSV